MNTHERFRPMNVGDIIDLTFKMYKENFWTFFGILAVAFLPLSLFYSILNSMLGLDDPANFDISKAITLGIFLLIALIYSLTIVPVAYSALIRAVSEAFLGKNSDIFGSLGFAFCKIWTLSLAYFLVGLAVLFGFILLIIPAIIFTLWYTFVTHVIVIEETSAIAALKRSKQLAKGYLFKIFLVILCLLLIVGVIRSAILVPLVMIVGFLGFMKSSIVLLIVNIFSSVIQTLFAPISFIGLTLLYYDLRIRKEGFDLEMLAQNLDADQNNL